MVCKLFHRPVADVAVAADAIEHLATIAGMRINGRDELLVTGHTVPLQHDLVLPANHDWLVEILERETFRMPESVLGLGQVFSDEVMWRVAIVTRGNRMVR